MARWKQWHEFWQMRLWRCWQTKRILHFISCFYFLLLFLMNIILKKITIKKDVSHRVELGLSMVMPDVLEWLKTKVKASRTQQNKQTNKQINKQTKMKWNEIYVIMAVPFFKPMLMPTLNSFCIMARIPSPNCQVALTIQIIQVWTITHPLWYEQTLIMSKSSSPMIWANPHYEQILIPPWAKPHTPMSKTSYPHEQILIPPWANPHPFFH